MKQITQLNKKIFLAISVMLCYYISPAKPNNNLQYKDSAEITTSIKEQTIKLSTGVELQYAERGIRRKQLFSFYMVILTYGILLKK